MPTFKVSEIVALGEDFPVPGTALMTVDAPDALAALDAYSVREGFAPYSATEMRDEVSWWGDPLGPYALMASAPFTNTEIMAYTEEALATA